PSSLLTTATAVSGLSLAGSRSFPEITRKSFGAARACTSRYGANRAMVRTRRATILLIANSPSQADRQPIASVSADVAPADPAAAPANFFLYGGQYWVFVNGGWHVSRHHDGPWIVVGPQFVPRPLLLVPVRYYHVPPGHWKQWNHQAAPRWEREWGGEWADKRGWKGRDDDDRGDGRGRGHGADRGEGRGKGHAKGN